MNKAFFAILATVSLAAIKSRSSGAGSFGLKRNKKFEKFDKPLQDLIQSLRLEIASQIDVHDEQNVMSIPQVIQGIGLVGVEHNEELKEKFKEITDDGTNCPDVFVYAGLYLTFIAETDLVDDKDTDDLSTKLSKYESTWGLGNGYIQEIKKISEDIALIRKDSRYTDECATETLVNQIIAEGLPQKGVATIDGLFALGYAGWAFIQLQRVKMSILGDKNLAEMTKSLIVAMDNDGALLTNGRIHKQLRKLLNIQTTFSSSVYIEKLILRLLPKLISLSSEEKESFRMALTTSNFRDPENSQRRLEQEITDGFSNLFDEGVLSGYLVELFHGYGSIDVYYEDEWGEFLCMEDEEDHDFMETFWGENIGEVVRILSQTYNEIQDFQGFLKVFDVLSEKIREYQTADFDDIMQRWVQEYIDDARGGGIDDKFRIGSKPIALTQDEIFLAQIPFGGIEDSSVMFDDGEDDVSRIILVEYRKSKTLREVCQNTPGSLCVGNPGMNYMDALEKGSERHFGVLAQTSRGPHVMYHTHATRSGGIKGFTNAKNNMENFPEEHDKILQVAKQKIKERLIGWTL